MRILLVDDDVLAREAVANFLETALNHEVTECDTASEAFKLFKSKSFPFVITDIRMPGMSGLELLHNIKNEVDGKDTGVALITGFSDLKSAVFALREGAFDYLSKPIDVVQLAAVIARYEEHVEMLLKAGDSSSVSGKVSNPTTSTLSGIKLEHNVYTDVDGIGRIGVFSDAMKSAVIMAMRFHDDRNVPVLIEGETGTGKEVIARLVHQGNKASTKDFISVNCSALSPSLIESELFGYEGGAFTGARGSGAKGKMELAQGSSLFLDEIGEMPLELQPKLLRALQEREIYRVGGTKKIKLDVRIVVATNRNLLELTRDGSFRSDLYYRLNLGRIYLPPLREQRSAIIPIALMFLDRFSKEKKRRFRFIQKEAMKILENYPWPGNIRELRNTIERVAVFYDDYELCPEHLGFLLRPEDSNIQIDGSILKPGKIILPENRLNLLQVESEIVHKALTMFNNNKTKAAEYLGISRHALRTRLNRT